MVGCGWTASCRSEQELCAPLVCAAWAQRCPFTWVCLLSQDGARPILKAAEGGRHAIVNMLLKAGAKVNRLEIQVGTACWWMWADAWRLVLPWRCSPAGQLEHQ
jgi:hypothetical protein